MARVEDVAVVERFLEGSGDRVGEHPLVVFHGKQVVCLRIDDLFRDLLLTPQAVDHYETTVDLKQLKRAGAPAFAKRSIPTNEFAPQITAQSDKTNTLSSG
jgi:hypothetical protein